MAKKVAGWGAFKSNARRGACYVDPDAINGMGGKGKCYRGMPEVVAALTAETSA